MTPASVNQKSLKVLVVEDQPINQKLTVALLERLGHQGFVAENGQVALDMLSQNSFDLVLMDVMMPVMDGLEAVKAIRAQELKSVTGAPLPVVMVTAHNSPEDMVRVMDAGPDGFLGKPIDLRGLHQEVMRVTGA